MTKHFTLLLLILGNVFFTFSKSGFHLVNIEPAIFSNSNSLRVDLSAIRNNQFDYFVIQPKINSAAYLQQNNFTIETYLGDGYYLVSTEATTTNSKLATTNWSKIGYIESNSKIDESLLDKNISQQVSISYTNSINTNAIQELAQQIGIVIEKNEIEQHRFVAYANQTQIQQLAKLPYILYLGKYYDKRNPLIYESILMQGINQVQNDAPYQYNLKGENVNVGIWDEGIVGNHMNLPANYNHVIDKELNNPAYISHPTQVAGIIGSNGNIFLDTKGFAPNSHHYFYDFLNNIVSEIESAKNNYQVDISNHSYNFASTNCYQSGFYISEAAYLDKLVNDNPTLLPVIASGNTASVCNFTDTFSSLDIGFQGCKNAITVGWLFGNEQIVGNSGRGPTVDGRLKPELVAKGFDVFSTVSNNSFGSGWGSSFAAPQVTGLSALLYQKYKQQFGTLPPASLIKAILCNTAKDLGNPGPDYTYGFGIPNALRAVKSINDSHFFLGSSSQNSTTTYTINVPTGLNKLNIALCWTDKESTPLATHNIVNDLDIKLVSPNNDTILPWLLNPTNYKLFALKGIDKLNTIEQVTVNNPLSGNYTILVKGSTIPFSSQDFAVTYFLEEKKIELIHPNGGELIDVGMATKIKWLANGLDSLCTIQLSTDSGATWQNVQVNRQLRFQNYDWTAPAALFSNKCLIKITSGNNSVTSASTFTIGAQLNYNSIAHTVCDKTLNISWSPMSGATAYKIYLFKDSIWQNVGTTSASNFSIYNLTNGKEYPYAISTIYNGFEGNHSLAKFATINNSASCPVANDVGVYAMNKPIIGRKLTSYALLNTEKMSFIIKNFGIATQNNISVSYQINGGAIRNSTLSDVVTANDTSIISFTVNENLSTTGIYNIKAWTNLSGDQNNANDTLNYVLKHLPNLPIALPFTEGFESTNSVYANPTFGVDGMEYADFQPEDGARFRSNESNAFANTGNHAITLDNYKEIAQRKNELVFTYNLSNYIDSVILFDFSYMNRGEADSNDIIYARGSDTQSWIPIYDLFRNKSAAGTYKNVVGINLFQKLKIENAQNFSTSTQIKIVQTGIRAATSAIANGGYTFDDFKLYNAGKDVALTSVNIKKIQCTASFTNQPITIKVFNNSGQTLSNVPVVYKINNDAPQTGIIPTIANNDTTTFTFNNPFNKNLAGKYIVTVWTNQAGDNYKLNDTLSYTVIVMQTVNNFPYYNDLEANDGNIFSNGTNSSWVWTTPQKFNMNNAAQDNKAWTTGATKGYNFNENSNLYMGCLDFSSLTTNPLISFNFLADIQTESDSAFVEYSTDGNVWKKLGCYNCGLNWYNGYLNHPYWDQLVFPWQVAHIEVPLDSLNNTANFMYRIHLMSDEYYVTEGIGIDDIHIISNYQEMAIADSGYVSQNSTGNGWITFTRNGRLVAELFDDNKNLGTISLGFEANMSKRKTFNSKNILTRNWVIIPQNKIVGNFKLRLYLLNEEYTNFVLNEDSINRMGDIGLLRYIGLNTNLEVLDNYINAYYKYYTPQEIQFYPYLNGYYVEFETDTLGEFYLISTKQDKQAINNINVVNFSAQSINNEDVYLQWETTREINSKEFVIQYSFDANTFIDVDTIPAGFNSSTNTMYNYLHELNATYGLFYYRIKMIDNSNNVSYTLIDSVYFAPVVSVKENSQTIKAYISENDIVLDLKNAITFIGNANVYNSLGQLLFSKKMQFLNVVQSLQIPNFKSWSNGALFLQIQSDNKNYYVKLMKQ